MKKKRFLALALSVLMGMNALAGCAGGGSGDDGPIKIGTIDPMTGASASYGQDKVNGMSLAVQEKNAAGGLLGRQIEMVSEDSASQAAQAATVATKLITQDNVVAIAGAQTSSETMAMLDVLAEYKVPAVTPATSPYIGQQGNQYINRCSPDDGLQVEALVKHAAEEMGITNIGVLYSNDDYGKGGYDSAVACADTYGVTLTGDTFLGDDTNFSAQLTRLRDAGCEAILMWCQTTAASLIIRQANDMGWNPQYLGCPGINDPQLFELSNGLCDGMILASSFNADSDEQYVVDFVNNYTESFGMAPSLAAAHGYDAMQIIFAGIEASGSTDPDEIAKAIRTLTGIQTLKGSTTIDSETGNMYCPVYLVVADGATTTFTFDRVVELD